MSFLLYWIECHKQVRHSPLIPVKQNTRETLEYNTESCGLDWQSGSILSTGY